MSGVSISYPPVGPNELVLGFVYGAGAESESAKRALDANLRRYGYSLREIHLSDYFAAILRREDFTRERPEATRDLQNMGDELRRLTNHNAVLAHLAVYLVAAERRSDPNHNRRVAWLITSLKRPEEVDALRQLYGQRFILLGLHVPEPVRRKSVERRWQRWASVTSNHFEDEAAIDIRRDALDRRVAYGQAVRKTFAAADFFIDGRSKESIDYSVPRTVRLIFGEPFEPPHREEQAMYHAHTASLRSAEMGRQVGAAIVTPDGELLAVGTNEVPVVGGGLYSTPDRPDHRDFAQDPPLDSNTLWQRRIARELLVRMRETKWLNPQRATTLESGEFDVSEERLDGFLRDIEPTRFRDLTEFGRAVHAEMAAVTSAARRGVAVDGAVLACTTFPCHNCTRHLIAAGISRILYIHPYEKSLARDLHDDEIVVEPERANSDPGKVRLEQYIGVAPRVYPQYFGFGQNDRKDDRGRAMELPARRAVPRVLTSGGPFTFGGPALSATVISDLEYAASLIFEQQIADKPLDLPTPVSEEEG